MRIDYLYVSLYYILKVLVSILPNFLLNIFIKSVARIVFILNKKHRKIIDVNLQICFSQMNEEERRDVALKIYQNFAKFGIDFFKHQNITLTKFSKKVIFEEKEKKELAEGFKSNRAIVLTTAHYGNWELMPPVFVAHFNRPMDIVGRALDSKVMNEILLQNRRRFDINVIDKVGGIRKMLACLKAKRPLGILTDQDGADNESVKLDFFGKKVNWLAGASVIAKKSEALVIPIFIYQDPQGIYKVKTFKAMDSKFHSVEELTSYQAKCCEEMIKFKPDEYFFFHKRFKRFNSQLYN